MSTDQQEAIELTVEEIDDLSVDSEAIAFAIKWAAAYRRQSEAMKRAWRDPKNAGNMFKSNLINIHKLHLFLKEHPEKRSSPSGICPVQLKAWWDEHSDKRKELGKRLVDWRRAHPEDPDKSKKRTVNAVLALARWREEHPEEAKKRSNEALNALLAGGKRWREEHPEEVRKQALKASIASGAGRKRWREEHPEQARTLDEARRRWAEEHSEELRKLNHQAGPRSNNTSGFKGVNWDRKAQKWGAFICVNGKRKRLGNFTTPEEAALAYNEAAIKYFGLHAYQNQIPAELLLSIKARLERPGLDEHQEKKTEAMQKNGPNTRNTSGF